MFSIEYSKGEAVIAINDIRRINFLNIEKLRRLTVQIVKNPCEKLIYDLHGIHFIDSHAFGVLARLHELAHRRGVEVKFRNVNEDLKELFDLIPIVHEFKVDAPIQLVEEEEAVTA